MAARPEAPAGPDAGLDTSIEAPLERIAALRDEQAPHGSGAAPAVRRRLPACLRLHPERACTPPVPPGCTGTFQKLKQYFWLDVQARRPSKTDIAESRSARARSGKAHALIVQRAPLATPAGRQPFADLLNSLPVRPAGAAPAAAPLGGQENLALPPAVSAEWLKGICRDLRTALAAVLSAPVRAGCRRRPAAAGGSSPGLRRASRSHPWLLLCFEAARAAA